MERNLGKIWSISALVSLVSVCLRHTLCLLLFVDCGAKNEIKSREPIRCRECGHRIMYKKRTKRSAPPYPTTLSLKLSLRSGSIRGAVVPSCCHTCHTSHHGRLTSFLLDTRLPPLSVRPVYVHLPARIELMAYRHAPPYTMHSQYGLLPLVLLQALACAESRVRCSYTVYCLKLYPISMHSLNIV